MQQATQQAVGKNAKLRKSLKRIQVLFNKHRFEECKLLGDWIYAQGVREPDFLHVYGLALRSCGNPRDALALVFAAHEQEPANAEILNSLGLVFLDLKDTETAIEMFKRATSVDQKLYDGWINLGQALRSVDRHNAAEVALNCAYFLDRSKPEPLFEIALMQVELRRYQRAAEILDNLLESHRKIASGVRILRLQIAMQLEELECVEEQLSLINRAGLNPEEQILVDGVIAQFHIIHDEFDKAIAVLEKIAAKKSAHQLDHVAHLGFCYGLAGRVDDGIATLKELLEKCPEHIDARHNLAKLQFRKGDLAEAFKNYESRTQLAGFSSKQRNFSAPAWRGEPIQGKRILVWREQGIGDEVMFASLLPELHELGCSVTFQCSPKLMPLWEKSFPWAEIRSDAEDWGGDEPEDKGFDFQIPVGSLGAVFRKSIADFDEKQKPWIARDPMAEAQIREQLAVRPDELLVGICWRSTLHREAASGKKVFVDHKDLQQLKDLPNVRWLNVQYASDEDELVEIRESGLDLHHYTNLDQMNDLVGACNLIGACDLVISVSVSVMDLAGGVGTPMVLVGNDGSSLYLCTDHVPWFKNCKLYLIKNLKAADTVTRIVGDWPDIAQWAENLKPEERRSPISGTALQSPGLDLEYQIGQGAST